MNTLSAIEAKPELDTSFTSTGEKLFAHQEAMQALRDGRGMPISCWVAPTDVCNHKCAFCSVGERVGDSLRFTQITEFLIQLTERGLKSVTFSGGGNPLLYRCKESGKTLEDCIRFANSLGLECALITNGMPLVSYPVSAPIHNGMTLDVQMFRKSWRNLSPEALDMLTWCRISMSGLDHNHKEQEVFVPDFDPSKTSLGFSWIMSDSYEEPTHKHGWVSTPDDVKTIDMPTDQPRNFLRDFHGESVVAEDRLPWIESQIKAYVEKHNPRYVRLLSNCLQPDLIPHRHKILSDMALRIDPSRVFSQNKPPRQPKKCFKVLTRPCLNADSFCYSCDSVVLNRDADHKFGSKWRLCRWDQIGDLLDHPEKYVMPDGICGGCVFADQVDLINDIVVNGAQTPEPRGHIDHVNFV